MSKVQRKVRTKPEDTHKEEVSDDWAPPWTKEASDVYVLTEPLSPVLPKEDPVRSGNVFRALETFAKLEGFIAGAVAHSENGRSLGALGGGASFDIEAAVHANTSVIRAKREAVELLGLGEEIQDILITLETQYHLMRPLAHNPRLFIYLALDAKQSNLAMARFKLTAIAKSLEL